MIHNLFMNKKLFKELEEQTKDALQKKDVKKALSTLQSMLYLLPNGQLENKCTALRGAYDGLLNCLKRGIQDNARQQSFLNMLENTYQIYLEIKHQFRVTQTEDIYAKTYNSVNHSLPFSSFQLGLEYFGQQVAQGQEVPHFRTHEHNYFQLFNKIWTCGMLSEEDYQDLCALMDSPDILLNDKLLIISAMFLSIQEYPDHLKYLFLTNGLRSSVLDIQMRSFVSLTLLSMLQSEDSIFSSDLQPFYDKLKEDSLQQDRLIHLIQSLQSAKVAREFSEKLKDQLMPNEKELKALQEEMEQQDDLDVDLKKDSVLKKYKERTGKIKKMADSGKDLNLITFGQYKQTKFFLLLPNWFYPFTWHHSVSNELQEKDKCGISKLFINQQPLCNSDKWSAISFFLQIGIEKVDIPNSGVDMNKLFPEMNSDWNSLCAFYVHDLYRFYKMYAFRSHFGDAFQHHLNPLHTPALWQALDTEHRNMLTKILYDHAKYQDVITILEPTISQHSTHAKYLAHSYQQTGKFASAIECYKRCYISETDKWIRKQLVTCYVSTGQIQQAVALLKELCEIDPQNETRYNMQSAEYLIEQKSYEQALNLLHKIEFFEADHEKAIRAISWCYLMTNRPEKAKQYWRRLKNIHTEDLLNAGHINWVLRDEQKAYACYQKFVQLMKDKDEAITLLQNDREILFSYGISEIDLMLMQQALQD